MINIKMPGRVWYDSLDPLASGMQEDLGLPQPVFHPKGRGSTIEYVDVPLDVAMELGEYLSDRAATLSSQRGINPEERELYRTMSRTAQYIFRVCKAHENPEEKATA